MTRLACPACGTTVPASDGREHECAGCGAAIALTAGAHGFGVAVSEDRAAVRVAVEGEIDIVTAPLLRRHLDGAIARGRDLVEIDLAGVTFMDVRGVTVLLGAHRAAAGRLTVQHPSPAVRRTLQLCEADGALLPR